MSVVWLYYALTIWDHVAKSSTMARWEHPKRSRTSFLTKCVSPYTCMPIGPFWAYCIRICFLIAFLKWTIISHRFVFMCSSRKTKWAWYFSNLMVCENIVCGLLCGSQLIYSHVIAVTVLGRDLHNWKMWQPCRVSFPRLHENRFVCLMETVYLLA